MRMTAMWISMRKAEWPSQMRFMRTLQNQTDAAQRRGALPGAYSPIPAARLLSIRHTRPHFRA